VSRARYRVSGTGVHYHEVPLRVVISTSRSENSLRVVICKEICFV